MRLWAIPPALLLISCGASVPPASLEQLGTFTSSDGAEQIASVAPDAWSKGIHYQSLAQKALDDGDAYLADRFAYLGLIQIKIAQADASQVSASSRLSLVQGQLDENKKETARLSAELEQMEAELERRRIRRHLEGVVSETRRTAAAQEELREKRLPAGDSEALMSARREVGVQMISRLRLMKDLFALLVTQRLTTLEQAAAIDDGIAGAEERLAEGDLAGVQHLVERTAIGAHRLLSEGIEGATIGTFDPDHPLESALKSAGFDPVAEEMGFAVGLTIQINKWGNPRKKDWTTPLIDLGKALATRTDLHLMVVARAGSFDRPGASRKSSRAWAAAAMDAIVRGGVPEDRVTAAGYAFAAPLNALAPDPNRIAVLLLKLPEKK